MSRFTVPCASQRFLFQFRDHRFGIQNSLNRIRHLQKKIIDERCSTVEIKFCFEMNKSVSLPEAASHYSDMVWPHGREIRQRCSNRCIQIYVFWTRDRIRLRRQLPIALFSFRDHQTPAVQPM